MKIKQNSIILVSMLLFAAILTGACGGNGDDSEDMLLGTDWELQSFGTVDEEQTVLPGTTITLRFGEDNQIRGSAGCNSYFGSYEVKGDTLSIPGPLASTEMACSEPIMAQEGQYLQVLQRVSKFSIDGDRLQLFYDDGQGSLNFARKGSAAAEIPDGVISAREAALSHILKNYGEQVFPAPGSNWETRRTTPEGQVGSEAFEFYSGDIDIIINYPVVAPQNVVYHVVVTKSTGFQWEGDVDAAGQVNE